MKAATLLAALWLAGCVTTNTGTGEAEPKLAEAARSNAALAVEYARSGHLDLAMEKAKRAVAQDDRYAPAHSALALLHAQRGDEAEAMRHYRRAVSLDPKDLYTRNNFGIFLCERGRTDDALEMLEAVARSREYGARDTAFVNAGVCAERAAQLDRASGYFREALAINPGQPEALLQLAALSAKREEWLKVRAFIQRRNQVAKPTAQSVNLALRAERALGDAAEADRLARQLQRDFP
jgi:type IV pilus assembly protein PilF